MSLYYNKELVDGVEELPRLTEEEFLAIPIAERPRIWVKRNATETDRGITASDVEYDNTTSGLTADDVQGAIDEIIVRKNITNDVAITLTPTYSSQVSIASKSAFKTSGIVSLRLNITVASLTTGEKAIATITNLPASRVNGVILDNSNSAVVGYFVINPTSGGSTLYVNLNSTYSGTMSITAVFV